MHKLPRSPSLRQLLAVYFLMFTLTVDCNSGRTTLKKEQPKKNESTSCNTIRKWWINNGFEVSLLPKLSIKNESLQVCGKVKTCCTPIIEDKLVSISKVNLNRSLEEKFEKLKQSFAAITQKYDSFCTVSIENSAKDLDSMFRKTYGRLYEQNSEIFTNLFRQLRTYYKGKNMDLSLVFNEFFQTLMQKMFVLLNFQYSLDDRYLQCVVGNINELKPFGDVPQKLSSQVKRAFVAARTYLQGLIVGKDVITSLSKVELSRSCVEAFTRMTSCPHCRGISNLKPCRNLCSNVMRGCLATHYELNKDWNDYIENMAKVMERLEGPFSLEGIIAPINVKISDAIMNFQEQSASINTKVFSGCGQPAHKQNSDRLKRELRRNSRQVRNMEKIEVEDVLHAIMQEAKDKLLPSKDIFSTLVPFVCDSMTGKAPKVFPNGSVAEESNCWNGTVRSKYIAKLVDQGLSSQVDNVEVDVDYSKENITVKQQANILKTISSKLISSFNGLDVDWINSETEEGSGGGDDTEDSGSGYDDEDEDDISFVRTTSSHNKFHNEDRFGGRSKVDFDWTTPRKMPPYITKSPYNKPYFNSAANFCMPGLYQLLLTFLVSVVAAVCLAASM